MATNKDRTCSSKQLVVMKKIMLTGLLSAALLSAQAQLFSPDSVTGAALGAFIGGVAGGNCRNGGFSGNHAAIGAGVGLLAGALIGETRRDDDYDSPGCVYTPAAVSFGYGYGGCGSSAYVYYSPNYYTAPGYYYRPARPNYAVNGTLLGAASGALIGAGTGDAGLGAGIGAAAGLVAGGLAEHAARKQEQKSIRPSATVPYPAQPARPDSTAQATSRPAPNRSSQITSRPCATSTYYWTTPPQIADAPRVPESPRF
jgi:uncharacterized protein YcfJ